MNINILTFHTPINYGAILQAYALQKYLKDNFQDVVVSNVDFKTKVHVKKYSVFVKFRRNVFLYVMHQFCVFLRYRQLIKRKNKFVCFLMKEFSLSRRYTTVDELLKSFPKATHYIVGSDQVFHPNSLYLRAYYLDFDKNGAKKIAYAPSFGVSNFTNEIETKIRKYLKDFDSLSCRETDGAKFLSKIVGQKVPMVADPIFLLTKTEWQKIAIEPKYSQKYIFIYDLNGGNNLIKIAKEIKKHTGYSIICQTQKAHKFYNIDKQLYNLGPEEFIGHLINAEYIVTDSFHGTAFSVLFNKMQYIYIARPKASSRIKSLMELIKGENRIIDDVSNFQIYKEDIPFKYDLDNVQKLINSSKDYIINSIN